MLPKIFFVLRLFNHVFMAITILFSFAAFAQEELPAITVTAEKDAVDSALFPDHAVHELPFSNNVVNKEARVKGKISRLSEVSRVDASVTDAYNAVGYWDYINVRGFTLDNRGSYLREGLPINAETSIPLDNKVRVEILKGLTGIQVGSSSPGGLVNYVVERPSLDSKKEILTSLTNKGNFLLGGSYGGRFHFSYEELRPTIENSNGSRYLLGFAHEWRLSENMLLEFEIESSRRSQPSQAGMSLLGNQLPSVANPNLNLNNQPWSQPVVFSALTGTLKFTQSFSANWKWTAVAGIQDLTTDDRLAYPFGCTSENTFDRFCSNGTFDVYDFRSEDERRRLEAVKISTQIKLVSGSLTHKLNAGVLQSQSRERFQKQAYNYVGVGSIQGGPPLAPNPALTDESTNRDSRTTEIFASDALEWGAWTAWLGVRHSDLDRYSVRTDGSRAAGYREAFAVPWTAVSYRFESLMTYFSYGEGIETYVTPNRSGYQNRGAFIPVAISRQYEIGLKGDGFVSWSAALFEIRRPVVTDQSPLYQIDGEARHRGLELQLQKYLGRWNFGGAAMLIEAKREGSTLTANLNGLRPVNVPKNTLRAFAEYRPTDRFSILGRVSREDNRTVTTDGTILLPSWTNWDGGVSYKILNANSRTEIRLLVENIFDQKYWRESPTQYSHIYLYPGAERNLTLSLEHVF